MYLIIISDTTVNHVLLSGIDSIENNRLIYIQLDAGRKPNTQYNLKERKNIKNKIVSASGYA